MDRNAMIKVLKDHGVEHDFLEANNGEMGLEVLGENYQDVGLILLDWQMPKMDGMDFMRSLLKVPELVSIPIIMVTASGSPEAKKCARRVNPKLAGYIVKPYKPKELMETIAPFIKSD